MAAITKASTGTLLTAGASWDGGVAPATTDVATWNTGSLNTGLTGSLNVSGAAGGVNIITAAGNVTFPSTLNVGTGGFTVASSGVDVTLGTSTNTGAQTWNIGSGRTVTLGNINAASSAAAWTKTGAGTITTATTATYSANLAVNDGLFQITAGTFTQGTISGTQIAGASTTTGIISITGGSLVAGNTGVTTSIGTSTGLGILKISGGAYTAGSAGSVTVATAASSNGAILMDGGASTFASLRLGNNATARGYGRIDGASTTLTGTGTISIGLAGSSTNTNTFDFLNGTTSGFTNLYPGSLTSGTANIKGGTHTFTTSVDVRLSSAGASSLGMLNLLGGTLSTPLILNTNTTGFSYVHFNGGAWTTTRSVAGTIVGATLDGMFVGPSGGTITANSATGATLLESGANFSVLAGSGVTSIPVSSGGSGYEYPPIVEITGGGGSGATARSILTGDAVSSIEITCPGQSYTSAPTVTLYGGTLGTAATLGTVTIGANSASGTLTKAGQSRLLVSTSTAGTFNGAIAVTGGEFGANSGATSNNSAYAFNAAGTVSVSAGAAFVQNISQSLSNPHTFSGLGAVKVLQNTQLNVVSATYTAGELAGLTGTSAPTASTAGTGTARLYGVNSGLGIISQDYNTATQSYNTCDVNVADLPSLVNFYSVILSGGITTGSLTYSGAAATYGTKIAIWADDATSATSYAFSFVNQSSNAGTTSLTGGIQRYDSQTGARTLTINNTTSSTRITSITGTVTESSASSAIGFSIQGVGGAIFDISASVNNFTGIVNVNNSGSLTVKSTSSLGAYSAGARGLTVTSGSVLILDNSSGMTIDRQDSLTISGTGRSSAGALRNIAGSNTLTIGGVTLGATTSIAVDSGTALVMDNRGAMTGSGFGVTKIGAGELTMNYTANTFTGAVTISAGTLTVTKLANTSSNSSIGTGAGTSAISIANGATLKFTGSDTDSTNRSLTLPGTGTATLTASGAGAITYTALTGFAGTGLTLNGTATTANTISASLTSTGTITKSGAGKWVLTTTSYSGTTTVSDGTLDFNAQTASIGNISVSGGILANGTLTPTSTFTLTGGQVTATMAGTTKTITASSGTPEIAPTAGANTLSGTTTVSGGTLRLTTELDVSTPATGRVLGTTDTTVQNGAALRTSTGTLQKGRMRYGGNLTFQAGSTLYIGG